MSDHDIFEYLEELSQEARTNFRIGKDTYREDYANALTELVMRLGELRFTDKEVPYGLPMETVRLLADISIAFIDQATGANSQLFEPRPTNSRRRDDTFKQYRRANLAILANACLIYGKSLSWDREQCFRHASASMSSRGQKMTWREVRSAWQNRKRLGPLASMRAGHEFFIQEKAGVNAELIDELADVAAEINQ